MAAKPESIPGQSNPALQGRANQLSELPWWAFLIMLAGVILLYNFLTNETTTN